MAEDVTPTAQIEALKELTQSQGWHLYREMVLQEISCDFEEHITKALDVPDPTVALDRMRQVAAVRKAGIRWLNLPQQRMSALVEGKDREHQMEVRIGRRPDGV